MIELGELSRSNLQGKTVEKLKDRKAVRTIRCNGL